MPLPPKAPASYEESLPVPVLAWLVCLCVAASFGVAIGAALGLVAGLVSGGVVVGGVAYVLTRARGQVRVVDGTLWAGRANLPSWARGAATPLEAAQARRLRGVDADVRAFLYLRGWVPTAVRVDVNDASDPAPYWYVSTRRPQALAAALADDAADRAAGTGA